MIEAITITLDFAPEHWTSSTRMVAVVLGEYTNRETCEAWPSVANIARRAGLSERMVQRHLRQMETDGWIKRGKPKPGYKGSTLWIWVKLIRVVG
jgi:hypothetical protein